jgi:hypothetical protein
VSEIPDAGRIDGLLVLSRSSLPELTGDPVCASDPTMILDRESFGGIFGTLPATDNTWCPDGKICCLSAVDFGYAIGGESVVDGPITLATSTVATDTREITGGALLLPRDDSYAPPGASIEDGDGVGTVFPSQWNLVATTRVTFLDSTGEQPWVSGSLAFPDLPWSTQICSAYAAPMPLRRVAWTHAWDDRAANFDRVLLSMRYEDAEGVDGGYILCSALADAGAVTIPDDLMQALPPGGRVDPVLIGERDVAVPLHGGGVVRLVLQNAVRLSISELPLGE